MVPFFALPLLFASALPAIAQSTEFSLNFGQSVFRNNRLTAKDFTTFNYFVDDGFRTAFRMTFNTRRFTGHEIGYAYNRSKLRYEEAGLSEKISMTTHQGLYSFLLYPTPEGFPVRPFVAGGGHFTTFYPPGTSVGFGNGVTKFGLNYGAGLKVKVAPIWGVRLDVRNYAVPKPFDFPGASGWLNQIEVSAGFSLLL